MRTKSLAVVVIGLCMMSGVAVASSSGQQSAKQSVQKQRLIQVLRTQLKVLYPSKDTASEAVEIGSEFCIACHQSYATWRSSAHATMFAAIPDESGDMDPAAGVIFDGNNNGINDFKEGLNFNEITSAFDGFKPNAPILSFAEGEAYPYRVTIGDVTFKVILKQGGYYHQRLITRIPVSDTEDGMANGLYLLPFKFGPDTHKYVTYHAEKWWDDNGSPRILPGMSTDQVAAIGRSWIEKCVGCHVTGYQIDKDAAGEWVVDAPTAVLSRPGDNHYYDLNKDGFNEFVGVGCEACHGPGSAHVLNAGDPDKIINPGDMTLQEQVWLCGSCHTRAESVPTGAHDFSYNETENHGYVIGENVWNYYQDNGGFWPDGRTTAKGENQYPTYEMSEHFTNSLQPISCTGCHDPHSGQRYLPRKSVTVGGVTIQTAFENNTLCLSCHVTTFGPFSDLTKSQIADYQGNLNEIAASVSGHTHHSYKPEGPVGMSRCTKCHMPRAAKRDYAYDETNHTMEVLPPEETILYLTNGGMPNSCAVSCHDSWPLNFQTVPYEDAISTWTEPTDIDTAAYLMRYYGPNGAWWIRELSKN